MKQANGSSKNEAVATSKQIKDENENPYKMEPYGQTDIMRHRNIWGKYTQSHLTSKEGEKDVAMERAWCVRFQFSSHSPHGRATFADKF